MSRIFVGGFPRDLNEEELKEIFEAYGRVDAVKIIRDKKTGISRRYGFVDMENREAANVAIASLHEGSIDEDTISVKHAVLPPEPKAKPKKSFKKMPQGNSSFSPRNKATAGRPKRPRIKR